MKVYLERAGQFGLRVLIDSQDPINAYDVRITYDPAVVEVESIDSSHSIVTVMPQPIRASSGEIIIKGGNTEPFSGSAGELVQLSLKPVREGTVEFAVSKATAYRADGTGAAITADQAGLALRITPGTFTAYQNSKDFVAITTEVKPAPEITIASITENPLNYGERVLVFQATDKNSGIAHYEARDRQWISWSDWRQALNPYPIDPAAWAIQIKAVNNDGEFALATVYQLGNAIWKVGLVIILLGIVGLVLLKFRKRESGILK